MVKQMKSIVLFVAVSMSIGLCGCTTPATPTATTTTTTPQPEPALIEIYDRNEAPFPPEAIAPLLDQVIKKHDTNVSLILVIHPQPHTQSAASRASWVCLVDGKPKWAISKMDDISVESGSGITAGALVRAREYVAQHMEARKELRGKEKPNGWKPKKEALSHSYQSKEYDLQITKIELIDRKTQRWRITAKPIRVNTMGGEIWMRFSKEYKVSAEFGR